MPKTLDELKTEYKILADQLSVLSSKYAVYIHDSAWMEAIQSLNQNELEEINNLLADPSADLSVIEMKMDIAHQNYQAFLKNCIDLERKKLEKDYRELKAKLNSLYERFEKYFEDYTWMVVDGHKLYEEFKEIEALFSDPSADLDQINLRIIQLHQKNDQFYNNCVIVKKIDLRMPEVDFLEDVIPPGSPLGSDYMRMKNIYERFLFNKPVTEQELIEADQIFHSLSKNKIVQNMKENHLQDVLDDMENRLDLLAKMAGKSEPTLRSDYESLRANFNVLDNMPPKNLLNDLAALNNFYNGGRPELVRFEHKKLDQLEKRVALLEKVFPDDESVKLARLILIEIQMPEKPQGIELCKKLLKIDLLVKPLMLKDEVYQEQAKEYNEFIDEVAVRHGPIQDRLNCLRRHVSREDLAFANEQWKIIKRELINHHPDYEVINVALTSLLEELNRLEFEVKNNLLIDIPGLKKEVWYGRDEDKNPYDAVSGLDKYFKGDNASDIIKKWFVASRTGTSNASSQSNQDLNSVQASLVSKVFSLSELHGRKTMTNGPDVTRGLSTKNKTSK